MKTFEDYSALEQIEIVIDFHRNAMDDLTTEQEDSIAEYLTQYHSAYAYEDKLRLKDVDHDLSLQGFKDWWIDNKEQYKDFTMK